MNILRAKVLGYCMGVRRAMETAEECLSKYNDKKVFTFGPLIHNKEALLPLEKKGLGIIEEKDIESIDEKNPPVVIIRAHGISPFILEKLQKKNCLIVDATCPLVVANQKKAASYAKEGYQVILAGDKNHGEVVGIAGFAEFEKSGSCFLVENEADALKLIENSSENQIDISEGKLVFLCQTTFSSKEFDKIATVLQNAKPDTVILKTICNATNQRQEALLDLCKQVDGVIVVGGKNSANTQRLYLSAKANCENACHIENASEIPEPFFKLEKIGITAGASTPDEVIEDVEKALENKG